MVLRYYICDNCDHNFIVPQKMDDPLEKKCPKCKKMKLYQDLAGMHTFIYQDPKTLGHQAQRNTERMGKYELESKRSKDNEVDKLNRKKRKSWYNKEGENISKKLAKLDTPQKQADYIMKGE